MFQFLLKAAFLILFQFNSPTEAISNGTSAIGYNGRKGVALIDSITESGEFVQCTGALVSEKHVLTSKTCCAEQSEPTVILGTTHAYSERGERFRTERHCWIGSQPHWFPSLQTCLLTLSRTVDFRSRDTVLPYHLPVHGRRKKAKNLIAFGFGSTTQGEYGVSKKLWALPMTWVPSEECMIPDSPKHHSCARSSLNEFGMLNHNDVGGPIMKDIDMELYALAGSWYLPVIPPGMPQYRSVIVPIAPILDEIYNEMDNRGDKCLK